MSKDSLGVINWWGFSPAFDLLENDLIQSAESADVNILLIGCGDSRHILTTLSKLYTRDVKSINIFVIESCVELYNRYILQLIICLIDIRKIGIQDKSELFLELYGNSLVRQQSMDFVKNLSKALINLITDPPLCALTLPFIDIEQLKFKERDVIESVFKMWRDPSSAAFDASLCWDLRVRQNLGVRYDAIPNVFDWDCSMVLHDRGASIINTREYNHWRHKGIAFKLRDAEYDVSNKTLASGRVLKTGSGDKTVRLGYWGDIVCSPFLSFGILSSNKQLFKKANHQYVCGASRVSEYNITSLFYEVAHCKQYVENRVPETCTTITEVEENETEVTKSTSYFEDLIAVPRMKITFLPLNALTESVSKKERFHDFFDLMVFSTSLVGNLETFPSLPNCLKGDGKVVIETPKFIVNINSEQMKNYQSKLNAMCDNLGLEKNIDLSEKLEEMAHLVYTRK